MTREDARTGSPELDADERDRLLYELPTNVVVAAGAGTGKTHRLSGLYVHLVAGLTDVPRADGTHGPLAPDAIVATTFTREAAAEMRGRIEARLRRAATTSLEALSARGDADAVWADELRRTCVRRSVTPPSPEVFRRALEGLPRGTITTFHSWAGELVRAHPLEAGVAPGFTLLAPEDADLLVARATREGLDRWLASDDAAPGGLLRSDAARRWLSSGVDAFEAAVRDALARVSEEGRDVHELVLADATGEVNRARERRSALLAVLVRVASRPPEARRRKTVDLQAALADARQAAEAWSSRRDEGAVATFGHAVKALHAAARDEDKLELDDRLGQGGTVVERAVAALLETERTLEAGALEEATRAFLVEIERAVALGKRRARALDFGDVLRRARDLLARDREVQAAVVRDVRALLVDEFQDTNALQRDLVYLVRQRLDAIADRPEGEVPAPGTLSPRGLFLVGDRKQSIYGFRGADVAVFQRIALDLAGEDARALLGDDAGASRRHGGLPMRQETSVPGAATGRVVTLDVNRRSVDDVLAFVNALAVVDMRGHERLSAVEQVVFQPALEDLRAVRGAGRAPGAEVARVVVPRIVLPREGEALAEASADLLTALALASEVRRLLEDPTRASLEGPLRRRDVAILLRTYAPLPALEFAFGLHGVEYAVAAGRGLFATGEAADLEALVRVLLDRGDRHALLAVLRGPWVALSDRALLALSGAAGLALPQDPATLPRQGLDDGERARLGVLYDVLAEARRHGPRLGAAATLRRAVERLGYEETLAALPSGEARLRDLRRLLEHAERFPTGLPAFARWLARGRSGELEEARGAVFDEAHDAVRILTVHASKGLEFRVVFVLQTEHVGPRSIAGPLLVTRAEAGLALAAKAVVAGERGFGLGGRAAQERSLAADRAERQRLTYVALTRARDLLYVVARPSSRKRDDASAARSIDRVLEEQPGLARRIDLPVVLDLPSSTPAAEARSAESASPARPSPGPKDDEGPRSLGLTGSTVVTTALAEFAFCARRFRLLHVVGLPEHAPRARPLAPEVGHGLAPEVGLRGEGGGEGGGVGSLEREGDGLVEPDDEPPSDDARGDAPRLPVGPMPADPRAQGVLAHLALERAPYATATGEAAVEYADRFLRSQGFDPTDPVADKVRGRIVRFLRSSYARSLTEAGVRVERERAFVVELPSGVALRGTIDLAVVRRSPGRVRVEIVDYKSGRGGPSAVAHYELQLRAYAAACVRGALGPLADETSGAAGDELEVVAGVVFLGAGTGEPVWLEDPSGFAGLSNVERIDEVARRLLAARARGEWPGIERPACLSVRCGFFPLCHPDRP